MEIGIESMTSENSLSRVEKISIEESLPFQLEKVESLLKKVYEGIDGKKSNFENSNDELFVFKSKINLLKQYISSNQTYTANYFNQTSLVITNLYNEILLFSKKVKRRNNLKNEKLRDPISKEIYDMLFLEAGLSCSNKLKIQTIKLKLIYTVLYYTGLRINEISELTKEDFLIMAERGSLSVNHYKTKTKQVHTIPGEGRKRLTQLRPEIDYLFENQSVLLASNRKDPASKDSKAFKSSTCSKAEIIKFVNKDIKKITEAYGILGVYSSHSFRVGLITRLLKQNHVQEVARIIGHSNLMSTMRYDRYDLDSDKTERILNGVFE